VLIAFFFFLACYMKMQNIGEFKYEMMTYNVIPRRLAPLAAYLFLALEWVIAGLFLFHNKGPLKEVLAVGLLLLFALVLHIKKRGVQSCTCFGELSWLNRRPIVRNATAAAVILLNAAVVPGGSFLSAVESSFVFLSFVLILFLVQARSNHQQLKGFKAIE
jgi:hypothetical protein